MRARSAGGDTITMPKNVFFSSKRGPLDLTLWYLALCGAYISLPPVGIGKVPPPLLVLQSSRLLPPLPRRVIGYGCGW